MFLKFQACPSWRLRNWCTIAVLGSQIHMDFFFFIFQARRGDWRKYLDFGKKCFDYIHLWVKFLIWNAVLRVSTINRKESFFRVLQIKCLSKCPYSKKPFLPWKIPGYKPDTAALFMCINCLVLFVRITFTLKKF